MAAEPRQERRNPSLSSKHELAAAARGLTQVHRAKRRDATERHELHLCPECDSELVYPTDWEPAPGERWRVELRCPDCEWHGSGVHDQQAVDRFDRALDEGMESVIEDLRILTRANMEEQVEAFTAALHADQILPEDF